MKYFRSYHAQILLTKICIKYDHIFQASGSKSISIQNCGEHFNYASSPKSLKTFEIPVDANNFHTTDTSSPQSSSTISTIFTLS